MLALLYLPSPRALPALTSTCGLLGWNGAARGWSSKKSSEPLGCFSDTIFTHRKPLYTLQQFRHYLGTHSTAGGPAKALAEIMRLVAL